MRINATKEIWDGSVQSVEKWAHGHAERSGAKFFGDAIWRIVPGLVGQARQPGAQQNAYYYTREAVDIVGELNSALYCYSRGGDPQSLWQHQKPPKGEASGISRTELDGVVQRYLKREWHCAYLEWCMLDALIFWEWSEFQSRITAGRSLERFGFVMLALVSCVTVYWASPGASAWFAGMVPFVIPGACWWWAWSGNRRLLDAMSAAYHHLNGGTLSPTRIREELIAAERVGVLWPTSAWPLLDAIIARNPTLWEPWARVMPSESLELPPVSQAGQGDSLRALAEMIARGSTAGARRTAPP